MRGVFPNNIKEVPDGEKPPPALDIHTLGMIYITRLTAPWKAASLNKYHRGSAFTEKGSHTRTIQNYITLAATFSNNLVFIYDSHFENELSCI